jgi:hypothetical protein
MAARQGRWVEQFLRLYGLTSVLESLRSARRNECPTLAPQGWGARLCDSVFSYQISFNANWMSLPEGDVTVAFRFPALVGVPSCWNNAEVPL